MKKFKFGGAFPDQLNKVRFASGRFHKKRQLGLDWQESIIGGEGGIESTQTPTASPWRKLFLSIVIVSVFSALFFKLFEMQIIHGSDNLTLADSNRIQIKIIHAPRGVIYDRNGKVLAQNEPGFRLLEKNGQDLKTSLVSRDEVLKWEAVDDPRLKDVEIDSIRSYPMGVSTSHTLGYISEITKEELDEQNLKNPQASKLSYKGGDKIGRGGIEESYEKTLRGIDGGEIIEVDSTGKKLRTLRKTDPIPGQNLYLSIDADLQNLAHKLLEETIQKTKSCCGAIVAQDPISGQILALASYPSFNPKNITDALSAPNSPLLNRAIAGTYPPGSTFKIASSLAGLDSGKIDADTQFEDTGVMNLGPFTFANWYFTQYGRKEGSVNLVKALKRSNDIFFYRLGELTGEKVLSDSAKKSGLGKVLGIDILGEVNGLIPDDNWKQENIGEVWYPGDTLHMAIGQGFVLTTPLQINNLVSLIAADGRQYPPHLGLKITGPEGNLIKEFKYEFSTPSFKESDIALVKQGLSEVPKDGGTAWPFFSFPISSAGKTGTAEYGDLKKTHAWYTGYAPANDPKIAVTVLIEGGGEGSTVASPIVKEMFRWFLSEDKSNLIKDLGVVATDSARTLGE